MRSEFEVDHKKALARLQSSLPDAYQPVTASAVEHQASLLGVDPSELFYSARLGRGMSYDPLQVFGEVFVKDGELFGLLVRVAEPEMTNRGRAKIIFTGHLGFTLQANQNSSEFEQLVQQSFEADLQVIERLSERTRSFLVEERTPAEPPTKEEIIGSAILKDGTARTLMQSIKASGGLLVSDLAKQVPPGERNRVGDIQKNLIDDGLLQRETVVVCEKSKAAILRYSDDSHGASLGDLGIRCSCGRPLADERREDSLTATELGRSLVDKSRWLTVQLMQELQSIEVQPSHIFIEQVEGGDEMDCLAVIAGETVLFELKDKTFSLGHAYSFGAKVGIIRPDLSVVVTTDKVGNDARDHFTRSMAANREARRRPGRSRTVDSQIYIEGVEKLRSELREIGSRLNEADAIFFFDDIFALASIHPARLIPLMNTSKEPASPNQRRRTGGGKRSSAAN